MLYARQTPCSRTLPKHRQHADAGDSLRAQRVVVLVGRSGTQPGLLTLGSQVGLMTIQPHTRGDSQRE